MPHTSVTTQTARMTARNRRPCGMSNVTARIAAIATVIATLVCRRNAHNTTSALTSAVFAHVGRVTNAHQAAIEATVIEIATDSPRIVTSQAVTSGARLTTSSPANAITASLRLVITHAATPPRATQHTVESVT